MPSKNCIHNKKPYYCRDCNGKAFCEHDKIKSICKMCKGNALCIHNVAKYYCKPCRGGGICIHDKAKHNCKECSPQSVCEHNHIYHNCRQCKHIPNKRCQHDKPSYYCLECPGKGICIHHKARSKCKLCKGSYFCCHERDKSNCWECGTSKSKCEHNRTKHFCEDCGGKGLCSHNKRKRCCPFCRNPETISKLWKCPHGLRNRCRQCHPSAFCVHGIRKTRCKECDGNEICIHSMNKYRCRICFGSTYCEHDKRKDCCIICSPQYFCQHQRKKHQCSDCGTGLCEKCGLWQVYMKTEGKRLCATCNPNSTTRLLYDENRAEMKVAKYLAEIYPETYQIGTYSPFTSCGDYKRPDIILILNNGEERVLVIVEVDEHHHENYNQTCEWSKLINHIQSAMVTDSVTNVLFIRFNPNAYKVSGVTKKTMLNGKLITLKDTIDKYNSLKDKTFIQVNYLYYPTEVDNPVIKIKDEEVDLWIEKLRY